MGRCGLNGSDAQHSSNFFSRFAAKLQSPHLQIVKRCAAFFVSPVARDFEIRIGTAVWVSGTCRPPYMVRDVLGCAVLRFLGR